MDPPLFRRHLSAKYASCKFIVIFVITVSLLFSFYLYFQLDQHLSSQLDLKIYDECLSSRRSNWKWGYPKDINKEERRIRDSLVAELNDIANKRDAAQFLHQQLVSNNSKLEEIVHELELLVKELKLKKKEYSDLRNVQLQLPHDPLLPSENPKNIKIQQKFNFFEESIDYRIPAEETDEWKKIAPLLPHDRKILVSFESTETGISEIQKTDFVNLQRSVIHSKDEAEITVNCSSDMSGPEPQGLCGTKTSRSSLLRKSIFVFVFPDIPSFQQRIYEALENGAIPVVMSLGCPLPFEEFVDWRRALIRIPYARFPEIHFILRSISVPDQLEIRRRGRFILENYLLNSKKLVQTILSALRYRLQIPGTDPEDVEAKPLFEDSYFPRDLVPVAHPPLFFEKLGPMESPLSSPSFAHNFTVFNLYSEKIWNNYPFYTQVSPRFYLDDVPLPSEAEFYEETGFGMRPIAPGSGDTFSEALGGNRPGEQFTVVIVTYNRDDILRWQLENLYEMPFLNRIIVIWNNVGREPPKTWPKLHVPVHFVKATRNSLNNRFLPLDLIETEAVLSLDDDMDLKQFEIIFAFRVWRQDRRKIVGFPARYHARYGDGIFYNSNHTCQLSMILTGAAFIHKSYFYAYTYSLPKVIHQKVDEIMNCEDIAMNFLVAHLIREPPIKTTSKWTIRCPNCAENLSNDPQHFEERHECIRFFTKVFGYNPLLFSQYRVDSVLFKTRVPPNHQKCYQMV